MLRPYCFRNGQPRHFVVMFCGTASVALFLNFLKFFAKTKSFVLIKLFFINILYEYDLHRFERNYHELLLL